MFISVSEKKHFKILKPKLAQRLIPVRPSPHADWQNTVKAWADFLSAHLGRNEPKHV
jgi:hypothetical protein